MKKCLVLFLALVMGLSLVACSQPVDNAAPAPATGFSEDTGDGRIITTLSENTNTGHEEVTAEFGFSVIIQKGDTRILFDTAKAGQFIDNAATLGIDISDIDTMVLSHAHYDHCGGVIKYYNAFGGAGKNLYVKDSFFEGSDNKYYIDIAGAKFDFTDGNPGYFNIGIDFTEEDVKATDANVAFLDAEATEIADGITIYGNFTRVPLDPKMTIRQEDGSFIIDDFDEEVAIAIETSKGVVIVTGCSHTGIVNIINTVKERSGKNVYAVIGGFRLLDATEKQIQDCIDLCKELGIEHFGLSHCTGETAKTMFQEQLGENTFINSTGSVFAMN